MKQIACAAAAAAMLALGAGSANAAQILIPGTSQAVFTGTAHDVMTVLVPGMPATILNNLPATVAAETTCADPALGGCFFGFDTGPGTGLTVNLANADIFTIIYAPDHVTVNNVFGISCNTRDINGVCTDGALAFVTRQTGGPGLDISSLPGDFNNDHIGYEIAGGAATSFVAAFYLNPAALPANTIAVFVARNDVVPEPLTLSLFGAGFAGMVALRRRKKVG